MSRRRGWSSRGSDSGTDDDRTRLKEGMKVEARFGGRDKWYKGKITYARSDGTFDPRTLQDQTVIVTLQAHSLLGTRSRHESVTSGNVDV